jgi:formate hydrogenlyase transcriptional activator
MSMVTRESLDAPEADSVIHISDHGPCRDRQPIDAPLAFEQLICELLAEFTNLYAEDVAGAITRAQRRLADAVDMDGIAIFEFTQNGEDFALTHAWTRRADELVTLTGSARQIFPWSYAHARAGTLAGFASLDEIAETAEREMRAHHGMRSGVVMPFSIDGHPAGAVSFTSARESVAWPGPTLCHLQLIVQVLGTAVARRQSHEALRASEDRARSEVRRLREQMRGENGSVRREPVERAENNIVVGQSLAARRVVEQIEQVAATDSTVLLLGETGTGKELCATQIHERSTRHARAMVRVNCAAIPSTLIESELFGREKGAFTGALARQIGRFEVADHSTIFLDEIGDLPAEVQVKLLRVLEERQFERLGSPKVIPVDTRIVTATHRNLEQLIAANTFREDLYYRLNVFPIRVPALRERVDDIPLLVWHFVDEFSKAFGKRIETVTKSNMEGLQRYPWPGNIRELRNVVERAMITAAGPRLTIPVPETSSATSGRSVRLLDVERTHIRRVLESTRWRIRGIGGAAEQLGLKPTTLETRLAKLGLKRPAPMI